MATAVAACQPDLGERWPGPCRAEWRVYETIQLGQTTLVTPILQGEVRIMRYTWSSQGRLLTIEDDDNGDGQPESRISLTWDDQGRLLSRTLDLGADGTPDEVERFDDRLAAQAFSSPTAVNTIWAHCQGLCEYDVHGNILVDRDARGQDVLSYQYGCWTDRAP